MQIVRPKLLVGTSDRPLFFLAGPIRGGGDWQRYMCIEISHLCPNAVIACPSRWRDDHVLATYFVAGEHGHFVRQLSWERYYMELAAISPKRGCLLFWLPLESDIDPHPGPEPYAMDTRGEIARWSVHKKYKPFTRLVVGADAEFLGLSQISFNLNADLGCEFPIYSSIAETAQAAVKIATQNPG